MSPIYSPIAPNSNIVVNIVALALFVATWLLYGEFAKLQAKRHPSLNLIMHRQRLQWMAQMAKRDSRIMDIGLSSALQTACAFFASSSLIAIGGAAALLRSTDEALRLAQDLPLAADASRALWEAKTLGLMVIFGYCFFKFTWAYRLFNYSAILIGATPLATLEDTELKSQTSLAAARMNMEAARHFLIGQRAMLFSFGYLGWFVSPYALILTTALIVIVIYRRQFDSPALEAIKPLDLHLDAEDILTQRNKLGKDGKDC